MELFRRMIGGIDWDSHRNWLLKRGEIMERRLEPDNLRRASRLWGVDSVRKWRDATLVKHSG